MEISPGLRVLLILHLTFSRTAGLGVTQPEMVTAEVGESVTITCSFTSEFPAYSVTWTIGCNSPEKLQDNPCYQHRANITTQDNVRTPHSSELPIYEGKIILTINNLTENDSLMFCCHIKTNKKTGTGAGTRLEVTPRSFPTECSHKVFLSAEIIRITCLIILIILLGLAVKTSC
ncbi:uncharacterized protein ACNLHF_000270 isoform 2-T2 [Anomaloglossus baeobatrachus]